MKMIRKDKYMVLLNSDDDRYSMAEGGKMATRLIAKASHHDLVRAGNGGFVGLEADC